MFFGKTRLAMDDKGRLVMPARYRDKLKALCSGDLVVAAHKRRFLLLYPLPEFELLLDRLRAMPDLDGFWEDFKRDLTANAESESLDAAGRLRVPAELRSHAGLDKNVVLVGRENRFELWDEAAWDAEAEAREARQRDTPPPAGLESFRF
jgi:MraZ protein